MVRRRLKKLVDIKEIRPPSYVGLSWEGIQVYLRLGKLVRKNPKEDLKMDNVSTFEKKTQFSLTFFCLSLLEIYLVIELPFSPSLFSFLRPPFPLIMLPSVASV